MIQSDNDLPMIGLRNDIRYEIQQLRKDFDTNVSDKINLYIEIKTNNNWYVLFCSPNFLYTDIRDPEDSPKTNIDYLKHHCSIDKLIVNLNGLYFDGQYSVHNPELEKINTIPLKTVDCSVDYEGFNAKIEISFHEIIEDDSN